jgi:toxin ParE1/3/4
MTRRRRASILPKAEEDVIEIASYIGADSPAAADRFADAFERACELLVSMPELGHLQAFAHPELEGLRSFPVKGFEKYLVFYRIAPPVLEIVRVLHGARDLPALFEEG